MTARSTARETRTAERGRHTEMEREETHTRRRTRSKSARTRKWAINSTGVFFSSVTKLVLLITLYSFFWSNFYVVFKFCFLCLRGAIVRLLNDDFCCWCRCWDAFCCLVTDQKSLPYLPCLLSFFVAISLLSFDPIFCFLSNFFFLSLRWTITMMMKLSDNVSGDWGSES